ncbi:MAG: FecR domain-containing protein [Bacteriovoracaceae bacterium]|nr:FecR domain-containing protein [Bacteriovoracaceae bacterium]
MSWKKVDTYLLIILPCIALYSLYKLLLVDYYTTFKKNDVLVAIISEQYNTVKKKHYGQLAWTDAYLNDKLTYNDQIYTYQQSQTTISFVDKSTINLAENTLLKIGKSKTINEFYLEKGIINARLTPLQNDIRLHLKKKNILIKSSKGAVFQIIQDKGVGKITLLKGKAKIVSKKKITVLKKNQYIKYDEKTKKEELGELQVFLNLPVGNKNFHFARNNQINFSWETSRKIKETFIFELSTNSTFKKIIKRIKTGKKSIIVKNLPHGNYYWRIRTKKSTNEEIRSLKLTQIKPPKIIVPENNGYLAFKLVGKNIKNPIGLVWKKGIEEKYSIEIFTPNNRKIKKNLEINRFQIDTPIIGKYSFRIRQTVGNISSGWSKLHSFKIKQLPIPNPPKPLTPDNNHEITYYARKNMKVDFAWKIETMVPATFELQVFSDKESEPVFKKELTTSRYTLPIQIPGKYFWKIRALDSYGRVSKFSDKKIFTVNLDTGEDRLPRHEARLFLRRPNQKVKFEWPKTKPKKEKEKEKYVFEVSQKSDFKEPMHKIKTDKHSIEIGFKNTGTYYWRTKIITKKNRPPRFTAPLKIIVTPIPPPKKPILPEINELKIQRGEETTSIRKTIFDYIISRAHATTTYFFVRMEWEKQKDIKDYVVEVFKDKDLKKQIIRKKTGKNYFEWKNPPMGTFYWRMAYIDYWHRQSDFSDAAKIEIVLADDAVKLNTPQLKKPRHKAKFIYNKKQKIKFEWKKEKDIHKYKFLISKNIDFDEDNIVLELETKRNYIKLGQKKLNTGEYFWRVIAVGSYGIHIQSKRRQIALKKPKPRIAKKERKRHKKIKSRTRYPQHNGHILFAAAPSSDSYKISGGNFNSNLDGTTIMSVIMEGKTIIKKNYSAGLNLAYKTGTVFGDQPYQFMDIVAHGGYSLLGHLKYPLWFKLGVGQYRTSVYASPPNPKQKNKNLTSILASMEFDNYLSQNLRLIAEVGKGFSGTSPLIIKALLLYGRKIFYTGGINFTSKNFKNDAQKIDISELKVIVGAGINF